MTMVTYHGPTVENYNTLADRPNADVYGVGQCMVNGEGYISDGIEWSPQFNDTANTGTTSISALANKRYSGKNYYNKKPLIRAPLWVALTAYAVQKVVRHSNGQLMVCAVAGTSGSSEPTFSSTALMAADGTVSWAALGRASQVNVDGYPVPTITRSATAPAGSTVRRFFAVSETGAVMSHFTGSFVGGSGYVDGTYLDVPLSGGTGTGAFAESVTVTAGAVVSPLVINGLGTGTGYTYNDSLTINNKYLGFSGSGMSCLVKGVRNTLPTNMRYDSVIAHLVESNTNTKGILFDDGGNSSNNLAGTHSIEFVTDDPKPGIRIVLTATRIAVWVDGYKIEEDVTPVISGDPEYYIIDWSGVRKTRSYRITMLNSTTGFGVNILPSSIISPVSPDNAKGVYFGDSYNNYVSDYAVPDNTWHLANDIFLKLGIMSHRNYGIGGSGYLVGKTASNGNTTSSKYNTLAVMTENDLSGFEDATSVVFCNGLNDVSGDPTAVAANALACWQKARVLFPLATISIFGPWPENSGPGGANVTIDSALSAKFLTWGDDNAFYHSLVQDAVDGAWISGTGSWLGTTGTGNSDFYTGADEIHPSMPGRSYLVDRIVNKLEDDLNLKGH